MRKVTFKKGVDSVIFRTNTTFWEDIVGDYEVSTHGQVHNKSNGITLKYGMSTTGYRQVSIYSNGKRKQQPIHRLTAQTFLLNPDNKPVVNHKDGNKLNNHISNLEWVTYSENAIHSVNTGLSTSRKEIRQYTLDGKFIKKWKSAAEASRQTGINRSCIRDCCKGIQKMAGGFIWKDVIKKINEPKIEYKLTDDFIDIIDYPNYMISPRGEIYSKNKKILLKLNTGTCYKTVCLYALGEFGSFKVHRLVAEHFIENPDNLPVVNHKDGDKLNNDVENLEWVTTQQNVQHGVDTGLTKATNEAPVLQYNSKGKFIKEYKSISEASRQTKINKTSISNCCNGKTKMAGNFVWKHKDPSNVFNPHPNRTKNL